MDAEKYNRLVNLLCPTCGSDQFSQEDEHSESRPVTCGSCGLNITRDDLIRANSENIDEHVKEIGKQAVDDFQKELARVFAGNKFIKIK